MSNSVLFQYLAKDFIYSYDNETDFSTDISYHMHGGWELLYIKSGSLSYFVDGSTFDVASGSLIITRPGAVHSLSPKGAIRYERHDLVITGELLLREVLDRIPQNLHILDISQNKIICELYERISFYRTNLQENFLEDTLRCLIRELWTNLYICMPSSPIQSEVSKPNHIVIKAIEFIKTHIREPLTVEQVSNALFISPRYLHQCFTKSINVSPKQYILLQKLQQVRQGLTEGASPTEICSRYSFQSYSTFYRNYQNLYGCRPSDTPRYSLEKIDL